MTLIQQKIPSKCAVSEQWVGNGSGPLEFYQFSRQNTCGGRVGTHPPSQKALRYARTTFSIWVPSGEYGRQLVVCAFIQHALRGKNNTRWPLRRGGGGGQGFMVPTKNC